MHGENIKLKTLTDKRFGSIILLFRLAGIPFHKKKISIIYAIYMRTVIICASTTYLALLVDVYVHWNDLGRAMTTMRVLIPVTNVMWIYTYCRYVRTLLQQQQQRCLFNKQSISGTAMIKSTKCITEYITCQMKSFYCTRKPQVLIYIVSMLIG